MSKTPEENFDVLKDAIISQLSEEVKALQERVAVLERTLLNLKGIFMRRHGSEEECIKRTPNHEFQIICAALATKAGGSKE